METTKRLTILVVGLGVVLNAGHGALAGEIIGWGYNDFGQADPCTGTDFVAVTGGWYHSLALKEDGSLAAWGISGGGYGDYGQVTNTPAGNDFVAIASGYYHNLALKSGGSMVGWGNNGHGVATPRDGNDFVAISGGWGHSLALKSDGSIVAWGISNGGPLDYGQVTDTPDGNNFAAIAAGDSHSVALKDDGSVVAWGRNDYDQLNVPVGNDFVTIAAGGHHSLALRSDGSIAGWGHNGNGQATPPFGNDFVAIAAGHDHSLALKADGSIVGWGSQVNVPAGNNFIGIGAGVRHSLALMENVFTYQGRLIDSDNAADGLYDFRFRLFDDNSNGEQVGSEVRKNDVDVIDGYFTTRLDFGRDVFDGNSVWIEVDVRPGDSNDPNAFTALSPRQEVTPTPYAVYSKKAGYAETAGYAESAGNIQDIVTGSGTANTITKFTDSDTIGDSVIYESAGNVGIGTTSPTSLLDVLGGEIRTRRDSVQYIKIRDFDPNGGYITGHSLENNKKGLYIQNLHDGSGSPRGETFMSFIVGNELSPTGAMTIKESGNVGIGTTAPTEKLDVAGNVTAHIFYDRLDPTYFVSPASGISARLAGEVESYGWNGNLNATFTYLTGYPNNGYMGVYDDTGSRRAGVYVNSEGGGRMNTLGPNGNTNVGITNVSSYPNNGYVGVYDDSGALRAGVYVNSEGGGEMWTIGPNGNTNVAITYTALLPNNGYVSVKDSSGTSQAGMYVSALGLGTVFGDTKSFRVTSPDQPGKEIWYTCLEGPEAAAYVRGTGHLTNGKAEVGLPDHFVAVASPQGITVQVTPLSAESKGLAVVEKAPDRFVVRELAGGDGTYDFDYMVMAVRKGHENYQVIRSAIETEAVRVGEAGI